MKKILFSLIAILSIINGYVQFKDQRNYLFKKMPITADDVVFVRFTN